MTTTTRTPGNSAPRPLATPGWQRPQNRALGLVSSLVIGVASTAPAYSLAATLGFVAFYVGLNRRR